MWNTAIDTKRGVIRWKALALVVLGLFGILLYINLFFDAQLKSFLENQLSLLNGARVEIKHLRTRILNPYIELKEIQIAHPRNPDKNLFTIQHFSLNLSFFPLLRKKIIVTDTSLSGVTFFTNRERAVAFPSSENKLTLSPPVTNSPNKKYEGIHKLFSSSPFPLLSKLKTGWNLRAKVSTLNKRLRSLSRLQELKPSFEEMQLKWQRITSDLAAQPKLTDQWKSFDRLPASEAVSEKTKFIEDLQVRKAQIESWLYDLKNQLKRSESELEHVYTLINQDIPLIRKEVQLPNLELFDLSPFLFGPLVFEYLERLNYWVEQSREWLPIGTEKVSIQKRDRGVSFHFANKDYSPLFLLVRTEFSSDASDLPGGGKIAGSIEGLTSDPSLYKLPFKFSLTADFPSRGVKGIEVAATVDHTHQTPRETFSLQIDELPIENLFLSSVSAFRFKMTQAKLGMKTTVTMEADKVKIAGESQFKDVGYSLQTGDREADEIVLNEIQHLKSFQASGKMEGKLSEASLSLESQLGSYLAEGLRNAHKNTFSVVDDSIRSEILNETDAMSYTLKEVIDSLRQITQRSLETELKSVKDFQVNAEKEMIRLSLPVGKSAATGQKSKQGTRKGRLPASRP